MTDDEILCDRDGCTEPSRYLLVCGERCPEHAAEDQPETTAYLNWARGCLE